MGGGCGEGDDEEAEDDDEEVGEALLSGDDGGSGAAQRAGNGDVLTRTNTDISMVASLPTLREMGRVLDGMDRARSDAIGRALDAAAPLYAGGPAAGPAVGGGAVLYFTYSAVDKALTVTDVAATAYAASQGDYTAAAWSMEIYLTGTNELPNGAATYFYVVKYSDDIAKAARKLGWVVRGEHLPQLKKLAPELYQAMLKMGYQKHHIATVEGTLWKDRFRKLFAEHGLSLDDPANLIFMPHAGNHMGNDAAYHRWVYKRLEEAGESAGADGIRAELGLIARELTDHPEYLKGEGL